MFYDIDENVKYKSNVYDDAYYFILPESIPEEKASESDLVLVKMRRQINIDPNIDYYPDGIIIEGEKDFYATTGEYSPQKIAGKIIYSSPDGTNIAVGKSGRKMRHSFTSPSGNVEYEFLPLSDIAGKFTLKHIFSVSQKVKIAINASGDLLFNTFEEAEKFTKHLSFKGGELNQTDVIVSVNEKTIHFKHYDVFINNELQKATHERLFDYLCSICKGNIAKIPAYKRAFPLRPEWFEVLEVPL